MGRMRESVARVESVWKQPTFGYLLLLLCCALISYWVVHRPVAGYSVTAMAVAGGLMALRGEISGRERWFWAVVLCAFAIVEIFAIKQERAVHEAEQASARKEQLQHFAEIGEGIKESITESERHFEQTHGLLTAESQNIQVLKKRPNVLAVIASHGNLRERALGLAEEILSQLRGELAEPGISEKDRAHYASNSFRVLQYPTAVSLRNEFSDLHLDDPELDDDLKMVGEQQKLEQEMGSKTTTSQRDIEDIAERLAALAKQLKN